MDKSPEQTEIRGRIVDTAAQLYRQIGHGKTTVSDIARRMSMSSANVYRFFGSKRAIEEAVAARLFGEVLSVATHGAGCQRSAAERLHFTLQVIEHLHADRRADNGKLYELVLVSMIEQWPVARAYADAIHSAVAAIIAEGQANGEFRAGDPASFAGSVLTATCAHIHPFAAPACSVFARASLGDMISFCVGALRPVLQRG